LAEPARRMQRRQLPQCITSGSASPKGGTIKQIISLPVSYAIMAWRTYASSPPPCRLDIIFDLEMVLIIGHKKFLLRAEEMKNQDYVIKTCYSNDNVLLATPI